MLMSALREPVVELNKGRGRRSKPRSNRLFIGIGITIVVIALIFAGLSYYQATRFNSQITINDVKVGGLTADKALNKLKTTTLTNRVYVGEELILDEKKTEMAFSNQDTPEIKKLLKSQWTFFPSSEKKGYWLMPKKTDEFRSETMTKQLEEKLLSMNESLEAPKDAVVKLEGGKIVISNSSEGEQYDIAAILEDYKNQKYTSDIHLKTAFIQPIAEDNPIIKEEENKYKDFLQRTVDFKVQDKVYTLKASELIKDATISKDNDVSITASDIQKKIDEINGSQSTLNKNFKFKTHSGKVISVKGQGYGWALDAEKEAALVQEAFENGETSISASNIYGHGWTNEGIGYETTANNGIGDTYAEVSIAEQRIWIYRNGKLAVTTHVVTGKHSTGEDTSPGVWYILFKRTPYTLKGSAVGKADYAIEVKYWAPFTNSGQGFHDASWRSNWAGNAYLSNGSGGCVNTPPSIMKTVYDNLNTYDPVVVY
ncbi:L,D-transpeptidase [Bacillus sp. FJAT-49732]|uniref:L,D-transpeptidase n=1 Tax=Lederbergia citrisecunda TaxID=2833583 RepID=A0A942TS07_9BACI|nr:L,D-transpeptidase family protein [Lederbergia citrisecunda]MBS4201174.1 L,D-transpeptidase [Lederbergia citrisecunda]